MEDQMRYAVLIYGDEGAELSDEQQQGRLEQFMAFQADLEASGKLVALQRLQPTSTATTVRRREGELVITDGPFAETKEQIAGFYVIECDDLDEALELASRNPAADFGTVEVRPVWVA
jgi:hypothetical protein